MDETRIAKPASDDGFTWFFRDSMSMVTDILNQIEVDERVRVHPVGIYETIGVPQYKKDGEFCDKYATDH